MEQGRVCALGEERGGGRKGQLRDGKKGGKEERERRRWGGEGEKERGGREGGGREGRGGKGERKEERGALTWSPPIW